MASSSRHRKRSNETRNAGSADESGPTDGSDWGADCSGNNFNIEMRHSFSERRMSGPLKIERDSRGTPTMFTEIIEVKGRWCVLGGSAGRG